MGRGVGDVIKASASYNCSDTSYSDPESQKRTGKVVFADFEISVL